MPSPATPLQKAHRRCAFALTLLLLAGLRHHLVWGGAGALPFDLRPWLDAAETACLVAFAWLGARGWLAAVAAVRARSPGLRVLLRASLPLLALAVAVPAFLSADVADYVMRGRVLAVHGGNPYLQVATDFPGDPFLAFGDAAWKGFPLPYGPLVADLQGAVAWLSAQCTFLPHRAQFVLAVVLLKVVFAACLLASALQARAIAARLCGDDGDVAFVAVLWCPLLLNEALATAHNESLLLLTILLAMRAALAERAGASAFALGLGVLTKIVPVLLGPLLLVFAARARRVAAFALGGAFALAVLAFYVWRFFRAPGALDFLQRQSGLAFASVPAASARLLGIDVATTLLVGRAAVLVVLAAATVRLWRQPTPERLLGGSASVLAALACFGLSGFGPWYHVWWVPLALLAGRGYLHRFAHAVVWTAPLCYVVWTSTRQLDERHEFLVLAMGIALPAAIALLRRRAPDAA